MAVRFDDQQPSWLAGRRSPARSPGLLCLVVEASAAGRIWHQRSRYRRELARLRSVGRHLIEDIGLSPEEADREAGKPFCQP